MKKMLLYGWTGLFALCVVVGSGGTAFAQTGTLPAELRGVTWTLTAIHRSAQDGQNTGGMGVTLQFGDDGRASGESTCNLYSAQATAGTGTALTFGPVISTKRACGDPDRTTLETDYLNALQGVSAYTVNGMQLQLTYNNGQSTLEFSGAPAAQTGIVPAELRDVTWTLTAIQRSAQEVQNTSGMGVTLQFGDDGRAGGQSTCNSYSATAQAGGGSALTFDAILTTLRACAEPDRTTLETDYLSALHTVSAYTVTRTQLQLTYNNGQSTLVFSSTTAPGMPTTGGLDLALLLTIVAAGALLLVAGGLGLRRSQRMRAR